MFGIIWGAFRSVPNVWVFVVDINLVCIFRHAIVFARPPARRGKAPNSCHEGFADNHMCVCIKSMPLTGNDMTRCFSRSFLRVLLSVMATMPSSDKLTRCISRIYENYEYFVSTLRVLLSLMVPCNFRRVVMFQIPSED